MRSGVSLSFLRSAANPQNSLHLLPADPALLTPRKLDLLKVDKGRLRYYIGVAFNLMLALPGSSHFEERIAAKGAISGGAGSLAT